MSTIFGNDAGSIRLKGTSTVAVFGE